MSGLSEWMAAELAVLLRGPVSTLAGKGPAFRRAVRSDVGGMRACAAFSEAGDLLDASGVLEADHQLSTPASSNATIRFPDGYDTDSNCTDFINSSNPTPAGANQP